MNRFAAAIALSSAALAPAARGDILYLTQERFIRPAVTQVNAPDFGPWQADLYLPGGFNDAAHARQVSRLDPGGITVSQFVWGRDGRQGSAGIARSLLDITFSLDSASPIEISGLWDIDARVSTFNLNTYTATFVLSQGPTTIYSNSHVSTPQNMPAFTSPIEYQGVLVPGTYRIYVFSHIVVSAPGSPGLEGDVQMEATIQIPAPASAAVLACVPLWAGRRRRPRGPKVL